MPTSHKDVYYLKMLLLNALESLVKPYFEGLNINTFDCAQSFDEKGCHLSLHATPFLYLKGISIASTTKVNFFSQMS
jgi:hypothetical protein